MKSLKNYFNIFNQQTNEDMFDVDLDNSWESSVVGAKIKPRNDMDNWEVTSVHGKTINFKYDVGELRGGPEKSLQISTINQFLDKFPKYDGKYHFDSDVNIVCDENLNIRGLEIESEGDIRIVQSLKHDYDMNKAIIKANNVYLRYNDLILSNVTIEANDVVFFEMYRSSTYECPSVSGTNFKVKSNKIICTRNLGNGGYIPPDIECLKRTEIPEPFDNFNNFKFNVLVFRFSVGAFQSKSNDGKRKMFAFSKKQFDNSIIKQYLTSEPKKQKDGYYYMKKSNTFRVQVVDSIINKIIF